MIINPYGNPVPGKDYKLRVPAKEPLLNRNGVSSLDDVQVYRPSRHGGPAIGRSLQVFPVW